MRVALLAMTALAFAGCSKTTTTTTNTTNDVAVENVTTTGNMAANMATPAAFDINSTSWEFKDPKGKAMQESVGPDGAYVVHSGAEHIDHGTALMKDGKACFTSAMDKKGEMCWTTSPVEIGQSMDTTSDKGEKLSVTRVAYTAPKM
jgi:formylmethanofuran dehydrogenase subunit A